jgi:Flp pilus assembly protein TadG
MSAQQPTKSQVILHRFYRDERGNFALIFAFCLLAIMLCIGAAMDYTRMSNARTKFQAALDSATLTAAMSLKKMDWDDAKQAGLDHFASNVDLVNDPDIKSIELTYVDDRVHGTVKSKSENYFMALAGINQMNYQVDAEVYFPNYPIEVSLVLDTTGSMDAAGKMPTLKSAAKDFIDTVLTGANGIDRKISIVPFAQYVNVGRDKMGSLWLDAADEVVHVPEQCSTSTPILSQSDCHTTTTNHPAQNIPESCTGAVYNDGVQVSPPVCTPAYTQPAYTSSSEVCNNIVYGDPVTTCQPAYDYTIYWNGCVASRNYPRNLQDTDFSFRVPGPNQLVCPSEITPLTDNKTTLKSAIDALIPVGSTYIPAGIAWGARTLSSQEPYGQAKTDAQMTAKKGKRFLVLMTDGVNVVSPEVPTSPLHTGGDIAKSDTWLTEACNAAKSDNIEVYTVSFGAGVDASTQDLMRKCASKDENYFHAGTNASFMNSFKSIADAIITLHLSM